MNNSLPPSIEDEEIRAAASALHRTSLRMTLLFGKATKSEAQAILSAILNGAKRLISTNPASVLASTLLPLLKRQFWTSFLCKR